MKNINIFKLSLATLLTITIFTGCGGGGDGASFENSETLITLQNCETYTDILAGDLVVQDSTNTSIKTVFNTDGSKKVCVLTGSAHIVRQ